MTGTTVDFAWAECVPEGVVVADASGRVSYVNALAKRLLGQHARAGRELRDALRLQNLHGDDWVDCIDPYGGFAGRRRVLESAWRTEGESEVYVCASLIRPTAGAPVDRVIVSLRGAMARERIERERSDLVATVAHELRSPLTGVKGFTSTLLSKWDRLTDSQRQMMLQTVDADADRLTRLISELLDAARLDSGRLRMRPEPADLGEVVARRLETLRSTTTRDIVAHTHGSGELWFDSDKITQVVSNLVENALLHADGSVTVTVEHAEGGAWLIVDDEGDGIPDEVRPRVFTKFWTRAERDGSGLGLYIVRGLIEAHGGAVFVEDAPSGGARLKCWLPTGRPAVLD